MPETASVLDLWPEDLKVEVPTPAKILRLQAEALNRRMNGLIAAEVVSNEEDGGVIAHHLELVSQAIGYRDRILSARHTTQKTYPVTVVADVFSDRKSEELARYLQDHAIVAPPERSPWPIASSANEFTDLVRKALRSKSVRATLESILARVNEVSASAV